MTAVKLLRGIFSVLLALGLVGLAGQARAQSSACTAPEADPVVEVLRSSSFNGLAADNYARANYDDYVGTISNSNFRRFWDDTCGSYKVPVRIVVPRAAACDVGRLAHVGVVELIHPFSIEFDEPGTFSGVLPGWNDPVYDPLLGHGTHEAWANFRTPFLFGDPANGGGGAIYLGFQANNFPFPPAGITGALNYLATRPENAGLGLHMSKPQDYAVIYRDASKWLRQAKTAQNFVNAGGADVCAVNEVIGFGYSFTSNRLKAVLSNPRRLNSTWGSADPIFPRGRVMDGVLLGGLFGKPKQNLYIGVDYALLVCPDVTASEITPIACDGPTASSEGPAVVVRSESDIQGLWTRGLRPDSAGRYPELDHFKVHEINSASHVETPYFSDEPFLEDPSVSRQNPLDRSPILRADLINVLEKIRSNMPLPGSRFMEAQAPNSRSALGIIALNPQTGNGFGGIALPQAAAPLGLYRGLDCHGLYSLDFNPSSPYHYALPPLGRGDLVNGRATYVQETTAFLPYRFCEAAASIEGIFTPYRVVDAANGSNYCGSLYPTRQAYSARVIAAADQLIADRLLLPEERSAIIAAAEAEADKYPECVPAR